MPSSRRLAATASVLALALVAACGPRTAPATLSQQTPVPASAGLVASPVAPASGATAPPASSTPAGSTSPGSSAADAELEAMLPAQVSGVTLARSSGTGQAILEGADDTSSLALSELVASLGKSAADLSYAQASDPAGRLQLVIAAYRIRGADASAIEQGFLASARAGTPGLEVANASVGGKQVARVVDTSDRSSGPTYLYPHADVLFFVQSPDAAVAAQALSELP